MHVETEPAVSWGVRGHPAVRLAAMLTVSTELMESVSEQRNVNLCCSEPNTPQK